MLAGRWRNHIAAGSSPSRPIAHRRAKALASPACGVAESRTTIRARAPSAAAAAGARRISAHPMRFVDDQCVPADARPAVRGHPVAWRDRSKAGRCRAPGTGRGRLARSRSRARSATRSITSASSRQRDRKFRAPLIAQGKRREDEHAIGRSARGQLAQDQAGFDRLALANGIGQQQPRGGASNHGQHRRQLVRQQRDREINWSRHLHRRPGRRRPPGDPGLQKRLDTLRARRGQPSSRMRSNGWSSVSRSGASGRPERTGALAGWRRASIARAPRPPARGDQPPPSADWQILRACRASCRNSSYEAPLTRLRQCRASAEQGKAHAGVRNRGRTADSGQIKKSDGQTIDQSNYLATNHGHVGERPSASSESCLYCGLAGVPRLTPLSSSDTNVARRAGPSGPLV